MAVVRARIVGLAVGVALAVTGSGLSSAAAAPTTTAPATTASTTRAPAALASTSVEEILDTILDDTNAIRKAKGLKALVRTDAMDSVAQSWTRKQAANREMAHNPNYSTQIPQGWSFAAENVAYGYDYTDVVEAWKNSPGHYKNMTSAATHIGLGYALDDNGRTYFTQNFAKYPSSTKFLKSTSRPTISGTVRVHSTLKATLKSWSPSGVKYKYHWYANGKRITGANYSRMKISYKYHGKHLTVRVTGKKSGYASTTTKSAMTAKVKAKKK